VANPCSAFGKAAVLAAFCVLLQTYASAAVPTFNRDIAPILYKQCTPCHRTGEVAPFSLITYQDAVRHARTIVAVTNQRIMPPWKPEPGALRFKKERRLTDRQIALIGNWVAHGTPEGDPTARPVPPVFPAGWQAGRPDKVFNLPAFNLPADGLDRFQCFVIPTDVTQDVYIKSFEFRPGNRRIVHHAAFYLDPSGLAAKRAGASYQCPGGPGFAPVEVLGGWGPGGGPLVLDKELTIRIPKGSSLVMQLHYHPSGKAESDLSSLGLTFGAPSRWPVSQLLLLGSNIDIPPGATCYVVRAGITIPQDVKVLAILPHAHYLAGNMQVTARLPGGAAQSLIHIKEWDFNWQTEYYYEEPVSLPKGTRVELEYTYDNSAKNPRNPSHPPVRVRSGEKTTDEMAVVFLQLMLSAGTREADFEKLMAVEYVNQYLEQGANPLTYPTVGLDASQRAWLVRAMAAFHVNRDGKLSVDERRALVAALRKRMGIPSQD
jgi:hypothetical protein